MGAEELSVKYEQMNKAFGKPCLVHAMRPAFFLKILSGGELNIPSERAEKQGGIGLGSIDELLSVDDAVFFKVGFAYNSSKDEMSTGFIFDMSIVDGTFEVFKIDVVHHLSKEILRYLRKHEPEQLEVLKSQGLRDEIDEFFRKDDDPAYYNKGLPGGYFRPWVYPGKVEAAWRNAKCYDALRLHLLSEADRLKVKLFKKHYLKNEYWLANIRGAEIMSRRSIPLDSPSFIGVFLKNPDKTTIEAVKAFQNSAKNLRHELIIFDGKKTTVIPK